VQGVVSSEFSVSGGGEAGEPIRFSSLNPDYGSWDAPPSGDGNGSLSFLGISFDEGETVGLARITTGDGELEATGSPDDVTQGGEDDVIALDDFIYGEPQ
jgi:hypothetical protein